jgi:predicted FMN-binding regulatory protein PaiB
MYLPPQSHHADPAIAQRIMREHPLASIVSNGDDGFPVLSHIPMHWQAVSLCFEMQITDLQCAVKLNQHRPHAHAVMPAAYAQGHEGAQALARWTKDLGLVA